MTAVMEPDAAGTAREESTPLWDLGAERIAVGAMMHDPGSISDIRQIIGDPDVFTDRRHALLFTAVLELHDAGKPCDAWAVAAHLAETGAIGRAGGPYLHTVFAAVPTAANGSYYARIVADRAVLRALDEGCARIRAQIRAGAGDSADLVERARTMVADLAGRVAGTNGPVRWADLIQPAVDALDRVETGDATDQGIPTGFPDLDRLGVTLKGGQVYAVAGESGTGKSTLVCDMVRSAAFRHQQATLVVNLEMSRQELFNKLVCAEAGVDHARMTSGNGTVEDWAAIARKCGETNDAPLWIDDTPTQSLADIRVKAHRLHREHGPLRLIVVDLVGLVDTDSRLTREQQVASVSRGLKQLAGELAAAVIVVAQLNRNPQQRADKKPTKHDLRESAQIEHDASAVIIVWRPEMYDPTSHVGEAILIVAKNRFGPTGEVPVAAQLHLSRFYSMAIPS